MLVLSRKKNESIIINGNIEVKIIESDDGKVRIGIDAPRDVEIHRKEIFDQIERQNIESSKMKMNMSQLSDKKLNMSTDYKKKIKINKWFHHLFIFFTKKC